MGHSHKVEMILTCTIVLWLVMGFAVQGFRPTLRPGFSRIGQTIVGLSDSDPIPESKASIPGAEISEETPEESLRREKMEKIADLKAQEVFVTRSTGRYECQACGYIYDEAKGIYIYIICYILYSWLVWNFMAKHALKNLPTSAMGY